MPVKPIPEGYHAITPYLIIDGAAGAIDFYKKVFSATELFRLPELIEAELHTEYGGTGRPRPAWLHVAFQWRVLLPNANHRYQVPANRIERTATLDSSTRESLPRFLSAQPGRQDHPAFRFRWS